MMIRLYYFLKKYTIDIATTFVGILGIIVTWQYETAVAIQQSISLIVVLVTLIAIIYFRSRERDFIFSSLTRPKDKNPWVGYGTFQLARVQGAYEITNADPGYIHSEILAWSDYKFSFDFKIANWGGNGGLGIVVRANNLANYIMLQIKKGGIGPHLMINGAWKVWQPNEVGLEFPDPLSLDVWYRGDVYCDKSTITVRLYSARKIIFDRIWEIPRGLLTFAYKHSEEYPTVHLPLPITLEYGSVGFRNWGNEKAFVRNVLIEKI